MMVRGNMAKKAVAPKPKSLLIPDQATWDEFVKVARPVWLSAHPEAKKKRGRRSLEQQVFDACDAILLEHGPSKKPLSEKSIGYEFTSIAEWVNAVRARVYTAHVTKPQKTILYHFQSWLLDVDEKLADLPSRILFYAFKLNPEFHVLVGQESGVPNSGWIPKSRNEKIPETVRRVSSALVKLRPYFTIHELLEFRAGEHSIDAIVSMVDAGHSREEIIKSCNSVPVTLEKFWRPSRR